LKQTELLHLFGHTIDSEEVIDFLSKHGSFKTKKPADGSQYVVSKKHGIDILFRPDNGPQGGKTKHLRKCQRAFLYSHDKEGHEQFQGEIPLGFRFGDSRNDLIEKHRPNRTWKIGQGQTPIDTPEPSHDRWVFDEFRITAHYNKSGKIMYFILSRNRS